ncbi:MULTISPECIES: peptidase domain-containing ABC transporter [unclassified Lysobacter]|uniref:peptidase domain-containing ABC transporter n=1 Tax=unclassified Lysobacter TaxID=2635362 RepID=UPI001BECE3D7|nr:MULTISPECIES: peptidase domain-containing ABC transporter [unclassified Lysobacter]MBT2747330.1 peptidase domain-containing ABC transporter [Lysobacter sp. ISL-42]MBT2752238.1 peptidase domain-containing ABC transporter [Lysobacter sp. ISL-50]MBT2778994.1 peptidase domain-containing ABC transporter [Lysobacter sp. ISL-54]MBT2783620.1 peptidase domain-containing ABC transporter [Lysobacter sp. ISL-52]
MSRKPLPAIQQNELAECGLACLAMIAIHHGHDIDLASLRRRFPVSPRGATLARLIKTAGALGFDTRPLRAEIEHLPDLQLPCVLHWDLNHFVVLKRIARGRVEIHDPARGAVTMPLAEFGRHYTGIALELTPRPDFAPMRERQRLSLRALAGQIVGLRRAGLQILALAVSLEAFTLLLPMAMQWVIDRVLVSADVELLHLLGIGFLAVVLFQSAITAMRGWLVADLGAALNSQWLANLFGHLLRLPLDFFEKRHVGGVMSRFVSVQAIQQTLTGSFVESLLDGFTVVLVLALLLLYSPALTALVLAAFALYAGLRWAAFRRLRRLKEEQLIQVAQQQSLLIEAIQGVQTIKLGNKQDERRARIANASVEVANREAAIARTTAVFSALSKLVFGAQRVLLIWICAWMALQGRFTAGMMVVFVAYADLFATRTGSLIDKLVDLRLLGLHAQRIADIALEPPEAHVHTDYAGPLPAPRIELEGVSFRYADDEPWILRDCSFSIEAGESVAIVGPSGCGKTTLAKLMLGLLRPSSGAIRIGGVDIHRYGLAAYRELFGAVMQEDVLFAGSIAENIAFFDPAASQEQIEAAARAARIHDDILAMAMGYETLVGDLGQSLSGGQKQRVVLARALYQRPSILLLDEATSHLDVAREHEINREIAALRITRIVIAHRPDTIRSADRVVSLRDGVSEQFATNQYAIPIHSRAHDETAIALGKSRVL